MSTAPKTKKAAAKPAAAAPAATSDQVINAVIATPEEHIRPDGSVQHIVIPEIVDGRIVETGTPAASETTVAQVVVVGPAEGRRRAGRQFGPVPTAIPLADLSPDDLAALEADPRLIVSVTPA